MRSLHAVLALGAMVVACSEQVTSPQPGTSAVAPAFSISNAPTQTGVVWRAAYNDPLIWGVPAAGIEVVMGTDARAFCALWPGDPSGAFLSVMTYADKVLFDRVMTLGQDPETPTQVWPYVDGGTDEFCAMVRGGTELLASGLTRGLQFFSDMTGGNGADINLWTYHGLLTRPDGSQAVFAFQMHWRQWNPTKVTASLR